MFKLLGRKQVRLGDYTQPVDATNFKWGHNDEYCEPYVADQLIKEAAEKKHIGLKKDSSVMDLDVGNSDYNHINGKSAPISPDKVKADCYDYAKNLTNSRAAQSSVCTYEDPWDSRMKQRQLQKKLLRAQSEECPPVEQEQGGPRRSSNCQGVIRQRPPVGDMYEDAWDTAARQKQLEDKLSKASKGPTTRSPTSPLPPFPPAATYEEPWEHRRSPLDIGSRLEAAHIKKSTEVPAASKSPARVMPGDTYEEAWDLKTKSKAFGYLRKNSSQDREHMPLPPSPGSSCSTPTGGSPTHKQRTPPLSMGEKINPLLPLQKQMWYHGAISRLAAENLLRVCKEGSFLVRESESEKGQYSLSIKSAIMNIHLRIIRQQNGKYILGENSPPFLEIQEMIEYYTKNSVPLKGADHLTLLHPVCKQ